MSCFDDGAGGCRRASGNSSKQTGGEVGCQRTGRKLTQTCIGDIWCPAPGSLYAQGRRRSVNIKHIYIYAGICIYTYTLFIFELIIGCGLTVVTQYGDY